MLRRSYEWMMRRAASPRAPLWLAVLAFAEGVFFPIPPDVILIPLVLHHRDKAWRFAFITLSASVLGGSVGYTVGFFLYRVGDWLLSLTGSNAGKALAYEFDVPDGDGDVVLVAELRATKGEAVFALESLRLVRVK